MNCVYCDRVINNKGSLTAHTLYCKSNPNRIYKGRSPKAGAKKGCRIWNTGMRSDKTKTSIDLISSGDYKKLGEPTIRRHMRRYLLAKNGNVCSICNTSEWNGKPVPLVCDHIDGDYQHNEISNFRLVCCNCDAQLPTYKSKNKGNGRKYDREYRAKQVLLNRPTAQEIVRKFAIANEPKEGDS